jgi:NAD(P)-dependent dehydrogenase (short-subunit alcohol dehydrogenase family)
VVIGGVAYHIIKRKTNRKKRRAKKASNGARLEVVVVAGSPSERITRSISLDLERRGFIVYIVCNTIEEEIIVHNESRPDIKPLMIDIVDVSSLRSVTFPNLTSLQPSAARASIERFTSHLQSPHSAFQGARPHHLAFRSLILIPTLTYPSSPIATLSPSTLNDLLDTRLLTPILTIQTFLPLLTSLPLAHPHLHNSSPSPKPSVLVLTPSIIPALNPAFHMPESTIVAGLNSFTAVLSAELAPLNIPVTQVQLGSFDLSSVTTPSNRQLQTVQSQRAETLKWDDSTRQTYGKNYVALSSGGGIGRGFGGKGSGLRDLNNVVFDAMVSGRGGVVRVGMGSAVYGFVGRWVPRGLVGWMMGVRKVTNHAGDRELGWGSNGGSRSTSPGSSGSAGQIGMFDRFADNEYVPVYEERTEEEQR